MNYQKQIEQWLTKDIITPEQAKIMITDINQKSNEEKSNKLITAISTIGSVLLGIGSILLVASNWKIIPNFLKIIILIGSTLGSYCLGYSFKYHKKNLPKVGAALLFLSSFLFGVSIILLAQTYNINANAHLLVLLWLVGILPLAYAFNSKSITTLSAVLFYIWISLFIFRNILVDTEVIILLPVIYLSSGILLFSVGKLHDFIPSLEKIGYIFRIIGIKVAVLSLFLLTFESFSVNNKGGFLSAILSSQITTGIFLFSILAIVGLIISLLLNPSQSKTNYVENGTAIGFIILLLSFFFLPINLIIYTTIYNILFLGLTIGLVILGYQKSDIKIINIGTSWLSIFLFIKYFHLLWGLMPRSIFFIIGGLILFFGGVKLEKEKKKLKEKFNSINNCQHE